MHFIPTGEPKCYLLNYYWFIGREKFVKSSHSQRKCGAASAVKLNHPKSDKEVLTRSIVAHDKVQDENSGKGMLLGAVFR